MSQKSNNKCDRIGKECRIKYKILRDEEGQITVFLAMIFFVLLGVGFLVFGGMREYLKKSLIDETFQQAGEDVLANYDRALFDRYHLFFLDPRESSYVAEDANAVITRSFQTSGFFDGIQSQLSVGSKKSALDENGKAVKEQIKKWETCQGAYQLSNLVNQLLKSTEKKESVNKALSGCEEGEGSKPSPSTSDEEEEAEEETEAEKETKKTWKEWKETLGQIMDSGILGYVVGDSSKISKLSINSSSSSLPSKDLGVGNSIFSIDGLSFTKLSELKKLYNEGITVDKDNSLLSSDVYLIPYIFDSFLYCGKTDKKKKHCLNYEAEYLIAGKAKDKDNLKYVADQLFLMRFLVNYAYAVTNHEIRAEADSMAMVLSGILGFPEGKEIVTQLLTASLCYGESLLEVRALFHGKKVALVKSADNWNLTFANAVSKLKSHADLKGVSQGVDYEQYLVGLLILKSGGKKVLCRMMDLMQCNVALDEPGFLLKKCLNSFQCTGRFTWTPWFRRIIGMDLIWNKSFTMEYSRNFSYQ